MLARGSSVDGAAVGTPFLPTVAALAGRKRARGECREQQIRRVDGTVTNMVPIKLFSSDFVD